MPRSREPSDNQIRWESIMFHGDYANEYDRLKALAKAYDEYQIDAQWFTRGIHWMFTDDGAMDWQDAAHELHRLAKAIAKG